MSMEKVEIYADRVKVFMFMLLKIIFLAIIRKMLQEAVGFLWLIYIIGGVFIVMLLLFDIYLMLRRTPLIVLSQDGMADDILPIKMHNHLFSWNEIYGFDYFYSGGKVTGVKVILDNDNSALNRMTKWQRKKFFLKDDANRLSYQMLISGMPMGSKKLVAFLNNYRSAVLSNQPIASAPWFPHAPQIKVTRS